MSSQLKSLSFILLFSFCFQSGQSQSLTQRAVVELLPAPDRTAWTSPIKPVPLSGPAPFLSFFLVWEGNGDRLLEVRFSDDGLTWSSWQPLTRDRHNPAIRITQPFFAKATRSYFQVRYRGIKVRRLTCHFFNPGKTPSRIAATRSGGSAELCEQPPITGRRSWCPGGGCPGASSPTPTTVSHLIVHHSAGTNEANDWAAIVRSIWDLHVNGNGWADIGYNFLIDPDGVVYEGRGDDILGAHFCGTNSRTMGVCVIGNFQRRPPAQAAVSSLVDLLAWKAIDRQIDPAGWNYHPSSGLNLFNISGHRDGCATACPGDEFYPMFPDLRFQVSELMNVCQGVTGIDPDRGDNFSLRLFPNPVRTEINLQLNSPEQGVLTIDIFSIDGRRQAHFQLDKDNEQLRHSLPLTKIPPGSYLLRLQLNGKRAYKRFVKH